MRSKGAACAGHTLAWNDSAHLKGLEFPVSVLGRYRLGAPHELDLSIHVGADAREGGVPLLFR